MNTRTTGLLVAFAFALITIGVVLFVYIRHAAAPVAQPVAPIVAAEEQIQPLDTTGPLQSAGKGRIQGTAKDDPERQVYDFTYDRIDPRPGGVYDVESPAGWIYLEDGNAVHVRAERGQVIAPAPAGGDVAAAPAIPTDPEEGRLDGDVVIRLFEDVGPENQVDPETAEALGTFRTDVLRFNALTGELSTPENVDVLLVTPDFRYRGTWMRAQFDQVRERFFARVERNHQLEYVQKKPLEDEQDDAEPATTVAAGQRDAAQGGAAPAPATEAKPAKVDLYHCVLVGDLMLQQVGQGRWLRADRLELWARLVDGQLPEGAIAPLAFGEPEEEAGTDAGAAPSSPDDEGGTSVAAGDPTAESVIPLSQEAPDQPNVITLTWSGPLVLSPLDEAPKELKDDHAAMRFSGLNGSRVLLTDEGDGTAECAMLHYGATTRRAQLASAAEVRNGTTMPLVSVDSREYGTLRGPVIRADLTTGMGSVDGGGMMSAADADGAKAARRIDWADRADFRFRIAAGRVVGSLSEAILTGRVRATDGRGSLAGDSVRALFARTEPDEQGRRSDVLRRLIADGNVLAQDGREAGRGEGGSITAAHLDVEFDTTDKLATAGGGLAGGEPTPRVIEAWGTEGSPVVAQRQGERLECGRLLANMERDTDGEVVVTSVSASEKVLVSRDDGLEARAERMEANGRTEVADFFEDVVLSRQQKGQDGATIRGQQVRLSGEERIVEVFGAGEFEMAGAAGEAQPTGTSAGGQLTVTWTKEMRFNDARGVIDCLGDVVATNTASDLEVDVLRSHRVVVELEPAPDVDAATRTDNATATAAAFEGRRVRQIQAIGESTETSGGAPATAELRRYVADAAADGGRKLERFARLTGDRILASEVDGTLTVPGPGTAALYDARAIAAAEPGESEDVAPGLLPGGGDGQIRGATLFRWDGALTGDRTEGVLIMKRGVEMVHKPLDPQRPELLLVSEELQTWIEEAQEGSASASEGSRISRIEAEGAVYVRADKPGTTERRELIADRLSYDAATGKMLASARDGNQVKLFDVMRGAPIVARELEWDLVRDAIRVKEMSGTAVR